jgi:hypothetical protein
MNKIISIAITILILGGAYYYTNHSKVASTSSQPSQEVSSTAVENSVIKDGIQYITITARSGHC